MLYNKIILLYNDEDFRKQRLIKLIDDFNDTVTINMHNMINKLEDNKGTLKVHWIKEPLILFKFTIEDIWSKLLYEDNVIHIIESTNEGDCKCCNNPPQKEDEEIKDYFKYLNLTNINEQ
jgi:hypothetical protein